MLAIVETSRSADGSRRSSVRNTAMVFYCSLWWGVRHDDLVVSLGFLRPRAGTYQVPSTGELPGGLRLQTGRYARRGHAHNTELNQYHGKKETHADELK
jgi:hypothetical protein